MKRTLLTIILAGIMCFGFNAYAGVQLNQKGEANNTEQKDDKGSINADEVEPAAEKDTLASGAATEASKETESATSASNKESNAAKPKKKDKGLTEVVKEKFIEGGWEFMSSVLLCLVLGLAFAIERLVVLTLKQVNLKRFITSIEGKLAKGDVAGAKEIARNTPGPVASIYYQGLDRADEGIDVVEKSIVAYGSVQMGLLEKGLVWISLFISLAPMLGFMGTVIGMIIAFDTIEAMGDIEPSAVAGGIKVALLTTVAGLIVAIILQIFYNLIVSIIDNIVNRMEDASITLVDMMIKYKVVKD
ncbi:MAG: MotA/TolQ/ExbB proton channel family protein [Bacteroidetes bacterium]|nr:MotA/TolQ/ExbB proton channel family protein [Bacteroidota bacterium]